MTRRTELAGGDTQLLGAAAECIRLLTHEAVGLAVGAEASGSADQWMTTVAGHIRGGRFSEAMHECVERVRRDPKIAIGHLFLAICCFKRGNLVQVERALKTYLALSTDVPPVAVRVRQLLDLLAKQKIVERGPATRDKPVSSRTPALRVGIIDRTPGSAFQIDWNITRRCNFTCSYCTVYDNAQDFPSLEQLVSAADKIARLGRPDVTVVLTGGEPTLHPGYTAFTKHLLEHMPNLRLVRTESNLSRTPRFYQDMLIAVGAHASYLAFHCSVHFEFTNIDKFLANVTLLSNHGIDVQVRLLAHPEHMAEVRRVAGELDASRSERVSFIVKPILKYFGRELDDRYTPEDLAWLVGVHDDYALERSIAVDFAASDNDRAKSRRQFFSPNELIARQLNRFKGMKCYAGAEMLSIEANGSLTRAVCFTQQLGRRPNIYLDTEIPASFVMPVTCPFDICSCPEDIMISKVAWEPDPAESPSSAGWQATPRNAPCPCGSGERYKHCHGLTT
jgi:MoaA/NifB/PqqE/SkfB family radical SAM enzyme